MATWEKICRVCSSPANYEIFAKIPAYLHASSNEFLEMNWQKPINVLIEETTGLKVTQEDGLPKSICALCISYLKHAVTFRDQVIKNALSLQAVKKLRDESQLKKNNVDKNSILITEQELCVSETRRTDANVLTKTTQNQHSQPKVSKNLFQSPVTAPSQEYVIQQMRYLNLLFDKDINTGIAEIERQNDVEDLAANRSYVDPMADYETESTSNEETEGENYSSSAGVGKGIFSYTEKNFEEDDIMNLDELRESINVNIPEDCKERKCRACFRRFMFEESYKQHMENCIEFKFLNFIEEINLLLDIRRKKAVSPHEFIRRMIFSLRKVCEFLKINCDEILLPPELGINNDNNKSRSEPKEKESFDETALYSENFSQHNSPVNFTSTGSNEPNNYNLTEILLRSNSQPQDLPNSGTPISMHNNILYEIERSQSRNTDIDKPISNHILDNNVKLMRPIPMHATAKTQPLPNVLTSPTQQNEDERFNFLRKLEQAVYQTPHRSSSERSPLVTPSISVRKDLMAKPVDMPISPFSAACNTCNHVFDTISGFELHNAMYHNETNEQNESTDDQRKRRKSDEERERIIAMFENEDDI